MSEVKQGQREWWRKAVLDLSWIPLNYRHAVIGNLAIAAPIPSAGVREAELLLRREIWLMHGHEGLYGDDGEMQCGECHLDYKRAPVEGIVECIQALGLRKLAAPSQREALPAGQLEEVLRNHRWSERRSACFCQPAHLSKCTTYENWIEHVRAALARGGE